MRTGGGIIMSKKIFKALIKMLPHLNIIISGMYIVFYIIDVQNSAMAFINNPGTKILLLILSLGSIISSILLIAYQRSSM